MSDQEKTTETSTAPSNQQNTSHSKLHPTILKLGLVSFFADISSEMLYPITPIFLTTVLGASMTSLGVIEGCAEAVASLLKTYSGVWSDKISKRKPFIFFGYLLAALAKPLVGFSQSWLHVLFARSLDRLGKGIRSAPRDALIADSVSSEKRGAAFGWHRGMDTLGAALGPLMALYFLTLHPQDLRSIYKWALIPGLVAVLLVLSVSEKSSAIKNKTSNNNLISPKKNWFEHWHSLDLNLKKFFAAWGVFSLTNSSDVFLLLKAKSTGASIQTIILLYCAYNLIYALSSPYLGKLSDRWPRKKILMLGLLTFALVYLGFGLASDIWQYALLFLLYGLYMGATDGISKAFTLDLTNKDLKATSLGVLGTITGLSTLFASTCAGYIWDHGGAFWTFAFGASGALLALVLLSQIKLSPNGQLVSNTIEH